RSAPRDHRVLVPVVLANDSAERFAIGDRAHELLALRAEAFDDLSPPGEDSHRRVLRVKLPGVDTAWPEVRLRPRHHPIEVDRSDVGRDVCRDVREPGETCLAAVLNAAAAGALDLDLELEREVLRLEIAIGNIAVAAGIRRRGLSDNRSVFDPPELRVAVPPFQAGPVKERDVAFVVVEIHRAWFGERHASSTAGRWRNWRLCGLRLGRLG